MDFSKNLRIVLLGGTGEGKSATGNSILDKKVFESSLSGSSVTSTCSSEHARIFDRDIQVVDTPGLFDTRMDNKSTHLEVIKCVQMTCPGPHCFLLVVTPRRFTEEHRKCVDSLFQYFGNNVFRYFIIVFTKGDDIESDGKTLDDFIKTVPRYFQEIIEKCNYRCISINNKAPRQERCNQVRTLFDMIDFVVSRNHGHYTNEMYLNAEEEMRRRDEEVRKELERKKEEEIEEMRRRDEEARKELERKKAEEIEEMRRRDEEARKELERKKEEEIQEMRRRERKKEEEIEEMRRRDEEARKELERKNEEEIQEMRRRERKKEEEIEEMRRREREKEEEQKEKERKATEGENGYLKTFDTLVRFGGLAYDLYKLTSGNPVSSQNNRRSVRNLPLGSRKRML